MPNEEPSTRLVGREAELAQIDVLVGHATAGEAAVLLLTGEPGIGKTALGRAACAGSGAPEHRLVVSCLPLQTLSTGLAPLRSALRSASGPAAWTQTCLDRMDAGDPIRAVDEWVEQVVRRGPLVVFVDDIQWADSSLRDVVLYLVAGPRDRRLAVVVTARTTGLPDGHPVHGWLADALRFPHVQHLQIGSLSRSGTEEQLAGLLGSRVHQSLVEDVFRAGRGNPYLTFLLAKDVQPTDRHLPATRPADLTAAVKGSWHQCSPATRTVTCLLAVAGGPQRPDLLQRVADDLALGLSVTDALNEAYAAGLLDPPADGRWWFHHPLQAEVLERSVGDTDRRRWQAAYARLGDEAVADAEPTLEQAVAQAVRHDQARSAAASYRWAMRAWAIGRDRRGTGDLRRVLRRAIALRPKVQDATETPGVLWQRVRELAARDGAYADELEAVQALLTFTDEIRQPLEASELLVRRMLLRVAAAEEFLSTDDMRHAVRLASADRSSWQYALALAELAHAGFWHDDHEASDVADEALPLARRAGHPTALTFALTVSAMRALDHGQFETGRRLAAEAVDAAVAARDGWAFVHAAMWESNNQPEPFGEEAADHLRRRREQLAVQGGGDFYLVQLAAVEAEVRLDLGDWQACKPLLRETLIFDPGPQSDLRAQAMAARLAAYQGRGDEAVAHVNRADELIGNQRYRNLSLDAARVIALLAADRPAEAYRVALAAATEPGVPVTMAEYLVPLAARALADQAENSRDGRRPERDHLDALADLRARFPRVIDAKESDSPLWRQRLTALQAWYDAETARAHRSTEEPGLWISMRDQCVEGRLPWLEMYACWRGAEAVLRRGRRDRGDGIRLLRAGYALAVRLAAGGTRADLEELGRLAHVDLRPSEATVSVDEPHLQALTPRERELLGYLVQGLTYAEIAATLVISEKTVSSHVSNLLRKTGTSSRIELARLVTRLQSVPG